MEISFTAHLLACLSFPFPLCKDSQSNIFSVDSALLLQNKTRQLAIAINGRQPCDAASKGAQACCDASGDASPGPYFNDLLCMPGNRSCNALWCTSERASITNSVSNPFSLSLIYLPSQSCIVASHPSTTGNDISWTRARLQFLTCKRQCHWLFLVAPLKQGESDQDFNRQSFSLHRLPLPTCQYHNACSP